jgi:hypothetical protein
MIDLRSLLTLTASIGLVASQGCPFGHTAAERDIEHGSTLEKRATLDSSANILSQFTVNDTDVYLTSDAGGPIEDQNSLSAGERGPTLLEDFIFRQKITHFDHERVSANYFQGYRMAIAEEFERSLNEQFTLEAQVRRIRPWNLYRPDPFDL